jgi:hypothetical protein
MLGREELYLPTSACSSPLQVPHIRFHLIPCVRTLPASIKRAQVEDIHALHLSENFKTLKTSGLLEVGRHGTGSGTARGKKVLLAGDLCGWERSSVS